MKKWILLSLGMGLFAHAEDSVTELDSIRVIGGSREELALPLLPEKVSKEKLETFQYTDVNRALRQAPGVYVREEEGQGLRPNIGLRGTNPDRSKKVVLLEDGILIGPAPYSAPAAYYTPNMNHVESLEVYKGFTAVPYGPNSIGGAIHYLSPDVAPAPKGKISAQSGSFGTRNFKLLAGAPVFSLGTLLQASHFHSDGFKFLDGGGDTGFDRNDLGLQLKAPLPAPENRLHNIRLRLGYANEDSHETYLGLAFRDFFASPYRRYSASALDRMRWKHTKAQLEHELQLSESALLKTALYRHDFHRAWYRLDRFRGTNPPTIGNILKTPTGSNEPFYDILRGAADSSSLGGTNGQLALANNDRDFVSQGVQARYLDLFSWGRTSHELEFGARVHHDRIQRNHTFDYYSMENGRLVDAGEARQQDTKNEDSALARALSFQDNISLGRWVFTGVGRYEYVKFTNKNILTGLEAGRQDDVFVPGLGVLYKLNDFLSARTSVNRAVTLAGLDASGRERREEATNYELGMKYFHPGLNQIADLTFFWNDYQNLTGTCTASTGCAAGQLDLQFSGGRAKVVGLEAQLAQGFQLGRVWLPLQFNATWIQATWENEFQSSSGEWGIGRVAVGDPLPYVPRIQYTFSAGMELGAFRQELAIIYQGRMYDQSVASGREVVPAYGILDWSGSYKIGKAELFAKVDNLLGREYLASLRPFGARPGKPRSFMAGLSYSL